jgi:glycosyltransferase involved in cell wall biosynthesis
MLQRLLESLIAQKNLEAMEAHIVVVDNCPAGSAAQIVERAASKSPFPVHYRHELRRGIPFARNRVLDEALALDTDWLAFIDDDQTAHPDAIERFLHVAQRDRASVVRGRVIFSLPEPRPFWCTATAGVVGQTPAADGPIESRRRRAVPTNGVLLSAQLFRPDGLGLRFNEALACEEDGDFFTRANFKGALIVRSSEPVLEEELHSSRFTFRRVVLNGMCRGGAYVTQCRTNKGYGKALMRYPFAALARAMKGIGQLVIAPLFIPFAMRRFKFTALDGGKNLFVAAGMIGALFSWQYEYYHRIDGC